MNSMLRTIRFCNRSMRHVKYSTKPTEAVIFMDDDDMVVCWHPEKTFPYECSLPLPEEKSQSDSVLCIGKKEISDAFGKEKPRYMIAEDLAKITFTCKHKWFPRARDKKAKNTKPDRPYL